MGTCRICGGGTRHHYPLCATHYYFNVKGIRFWIAFALTLIVEYIINWPVFDENSLRLMVIHTLFEETGSLIFFFGEIAMQVIIFIGSLMYMNYLVYKYFCSRKGLGLDLD